MVYVALTVSEHRWLLNAELASDPDCVYDTQDLYDVEIVTDADQTLVNGLVGKGLVKIICTNGRQRLVPTDSGKYWLRWYAGMDDCMPNRRNWLWQCILEGEDTIDVSDVLWSKECRELMLLEIIEQQNDSEDDEITASVTEHGKHVRELANSRLSQ